MPHREGIKEQLAKIELKGVRIIDWGRGTRPAIKYLKHVSEDCSYLGIDIRKDVEADFVADIGQLVNVTRNGVKAHVAFCLEVIEHVYNFEMAIDNIAFNLHRNGLLYLSAPFLYPVHSDIDLWRFTNIGLTILLNKAGFAVLEITPTTADNAGWFVKAMKL